MKSEIEKRGRLVSHNKDLVFEYRSENPQTVVETDYAFDASNYIDWLEIELLSARALIKAWR